MVVLLRPVAKSKFRHKKLDNILEAADVVNLAGTKSLSTMVARLRTNLKLHPLIEKL